jgi:hypothetical protein
MLRFYPHRKAKKMRLEKYREAWHYLDPTDPSRRPPITIHAEADETVYDETDLDAHEDESREGTTSVVPQSPRLIERFSAAVSRLLWLFSL